MAFFFLQGWRRNGPPYSTSDWLSVSRLTSGSQLEPGLGEYRGVPGVESLDARQNSFLFPVQLFLVSADFKLVDAICFFNEHRVQITSESCTFGFLVGLQPPQYVPGSSYRFLFAEKERHRRSSEGT